MLLKRGPILFDGTEERELLMFTHGCLLSRMEFDTLLNVLFTINSENPEFLDQEELRKRFNAIDTDGSGCKSLFLSGLFCTLPIALFLPISFPGCTVFPFTGLDRCELKEVFSGMGVPISEKALSDIIDRFDADHDGTIDFDGK